MDSSCPPDVARLRDALALLTLQQRAMAGLAARAEVESLAALMEPSRGSA